MPRKNLIRSNEHYYHIVNRSNHKAWFTCHLDDVWTLAKDALAFAHQKHPVEVAQFVLMSNHFHLLVRTPSANIDSYMYEFGKRFSLKLRQKTNLINRMFAGRYKWSLIKNDGHLLTVARYIYQNPLQAKVVNNCQDYPYSTLGSQLRGDKFSIPLMCPFEINPRFLDWINTPIGEGKLKDIKKGLRKTNFYLSTEL